MQPLCRETFFANYHERVIMNISWIANIVYLVLKIFFFKVCFFVLLYNALNEKLAYISNRALALSLFDAIAKVWKKKLRAQILGTVYIIRIFNLIFGTACPNWLTYKCWAESVINILLVIYFSNLIWKSCFSNHVKTAKIKIC